jgi:hypothetical protein
MSILPEWSRNVLVMSPLQLELRKQLHQMLTPLELREQVNLLANELIEMLQHRGDSKVAMLLGLAATWDGLAAIKMRELRGKVGSA